MGIVSAHGGLVNVKPIIQDGQRLVGATHKSGFSIPVYDDGFGPLFIHRHSIGISGIVRAQTWEDAYSICEDEFFPEADETVEELQKEYGFRRKHKKVVRDATAQAGEHTSAGERLVLDSDYVNGKLPDGLFIRWATIETPDPEAWIDNELFQEAFGFRPNGARSGKWENGEPRDPIGHGIYAKDLNGDRLELLTPELLQSLAIKLQIENEE